MKKSDRRLRLQSPEFVGTNKSSTHPGLANGANANIPGLDSLSECVWKRNSEWFKSSLVTGYRVKNSEPSNSSQTPQTNNYKNESRDDSTQDWNNFDQRSFNSMIERKSTQISSSRKTSESTNTFSCLKLLHCFSENDDSSLPCKLSQEKLNKLEESPFLVHISSDNTDLENDHSNQSPDDNEVFFSCEGDTQASILQNSNENKSIIASGGSPMNLHHMEPEMEYKDCENIPNRNICGPANDSRIQNHNADNDQAESHQEHSNIIKEIPAADMEFKRIGNEVANADLARDFQTICQNQESEQTFTNPEINVANSYCQKTDNNTTEIPLSDKSESEFSVISDDQNDDFPDKADMSPTHNEEANDFLKDCAVLNHGSGCNESFEMLEENKEPGHNAQDHSSPELIKENLSKLKDADNFL